MKNIKFGWLSGFGMLIAGVGMIFVAVSALGILFDFQLVVSDVPLPHDWASVGMLAGALGLIAALSVYGAFMTTKFKAAKGKPGVRVALIVIGLGLLVLAFRGIQVVALTGTYGSMLAYYATDGDLEDVKAELADKPKQEHLDEAVSRAAGYGNTGALKLLLAAGATFMDTGSPEEHRRCALGSSKAGIEFIQIAIDAGATPDTCPNSPDLIYDKVRGQQGDAEIALIVTALRGAGWSPSIKPDYAKQTALEKIEKKGDMPLTAAALR